ncbi:hypothetical protein FLONG3_5002 [Fusarium longipes]|uniref:Uncharacterized protein n=1 Tax=Fusarium longipes TaxID=694270 RepID=A0A395SXT1_9HYPO|nr:hypothetical protein FLONG3_5002 [Fusarium longipes]
MSVVAHSIQSHDTDAVNMSSTSASSPVQIILTPPTPIIPAAPGTPDQDTHKEVHRLPDVSEEKEVVDTTDYSDEKQVYNERDAYDEKEVYVPITDKDSKEVGLEKEVHNLKLHDGHDEKQLYDPSNHEKEVLCTQDQDDAQSISTSTELSETSQPHPKTDPFGYKRHVNKFNEAVGKKKKAWSTFTNNSSTAMTEKMIQMDKGWKQRVDVFEESTMAKMGAIDRSISDGFDRAGNSYNSTVTGWKMGIVNKKKQSISSMKSLGSKCQISGKGTKAEADEEK